MRLLLDFETYYDKDYSLSKMPTLQYIRDPRFKVLGCAVKFLDSNIPAKWLDEAKCAAFFKTLASADLSQSMLVGHNLAFDYAVLTEKYGIKNFGVLYCTMNALRYMISQSLLPMNMGASLRGYGEYVGMTKGDTEEAVNQGGAELESYALNDLAITEHLYRESRLVFPSLEIAISSENVRMAAEPLLDLDIEVLKEAAKYSDEDKAYDKYIRKAENFVQELQKLGVEPEYKTTAKGNYKLAVAKTDDFINNLLKHENDAVVELATRKLSAGSSIERTKSQRFLDTGAPINVPLSYYGCHTGRDSGLEGMNLQNMKRGGATRASLLAPEGCSLVIIDSSQIEVRVLAYLAKDEALQDLFKGDPYKRFGSLYMYHKPESEITKDERQRAKAPVLGLGFGMGANGFMLYSERSGCPITYEESQNIVQIYRNSFRNVMAYHKACLSEILTTGKQVLPSGRCLMYDNIHVAGSEGYKFEKKKIFMRDNVAPRLWGGLATENAVQAAARDLVFYQILWILNKSRRLYPRLVLRVHDEAVFVVKDECVEEFKRIAEDGFKIAPPFMQGIIVKGESAVAKKYTK